jgi:hypothetical protein
MTPRGIFVTRDGYVNPLPYSVWTVDPVRDREGHWSRLDPKNTTTASRQMCTSLVGERLAGRTLEPGEKVFVRLEETV